MVKIDINGVDFFLKCKLFFGRIRESRRRPKLKINCIPVFGFDALLEKTRGNAMHKRNGILVAAIAAMLSFNQAYAQSSHDVLTDVDADLPDADSDRFEIASPNGKYKMGFKGHVQQHNQYTYNPKAPKDEAHDLLIEVKRARFSVLGNVLDPRVTYLFQIGLEGKDIPVGERGGLNYDAPGTKFLRDYYVNLSTEDSYFQLRLGKFRTPFSRQQLMSTSQMQFYDQSAANERFQITNTGRDIGLMIHNGWRDQFEWALAAVSNGLIARVGVNVNEIDGYDLSDFAQTGFRFAFAVNGFLHTDYVQNWDIDDLRGGADFILKANGFSTNGSFFYQREKEDAASKALHHLGGGIDLGYMFNTNTQGKIEPVVRYSWIKEGDEEGAQKEPHEHEIIAGLNYYIFGHHLKVQNYVGTNLSGKEFTEWNGGVQVQLAY